MELQAEDIPPYSCNHQFVGAVDRQIQQAIDIALSGEGNKLGLLKNDLRRSGFIHLFVDVPGGRE